MEMAPQVPGDRTPYSASSSGKLKARSTMGMKRSGGGTPYERPGSAARRAPQPLAHRDNAGWIRGGAGIVHSASKILTKSAVFLFNSMFKRQAPSIGAPPEDSALSSEDVPPLEVAQPPEVMACERNDILIGQAEGEGKASGSASLQAADLENILKQKDLTREECERYINLIQSKIMDAAPEPGPSSTPVVSDRHVYRSTRTAFSPENQRLETQRETAQALVTWEEPPVRPTPAERRVRFQQPEARSERWTPIQMPIAGGRELLKQRATASSDKSPGSKEVSPSRGASFSLRGPSLVPGPTLKRKTSADSMDLTCFRSAAGATTKRKTSLRLGVPSIPGQSSRTAQRILDSLERRSAFKKPDPDDTTTTPPKARPPKPRVPALKTTTAAPSMFSFPATANGPEPPTPKPMPSPYSQEKKPRDEAAEVNHVRNGLLPSFPDPGFEKPFSNGLPELPELPESSLFTAEEAFEKIVQRVEKASSILAGDGVGAGARVAPSLTNSPSFSDGVGFPSSTGGFVDLTSNSLSRWEELASTNPFQSLSSGGGGLTPTSTPTSSSTTTTIVTSAATCSNTGSGGFESNSFLFGAWKPASACLDPDEMWVGAAQSLAPPDSNPAIAPPPPLPSNGGGLVAKRKKSTRRLK